MATEQQKIEQVRSAYKIALGVAATLGGVVLIVVLLALMLKLAYVTPSVAGGLTDLQRNERLATSQAEDQKLISTYGWMDKKNGVVRLPVDLAMEKLIAEAK